MDEIKYTVDKSIIWNCIDDYWYNIGCHAFYCGWKWYRIHEKSTENRWIIGFTVLFLFHDVYNPLNNRYDAKTEIEKLEKMV